MKQGIFVDKSTSTCGKSNKTALKAKLHFNFTSSFWTKTTSQIAQCRAFKSENIKSCFHGDAKLVFRSESVEGTEGEGPTSAVESSHRVSNN